MYSTLLLFLECLCDAERSLFRFLLIPWRQRLDNEDNDDHDEDDDEDDEDDDQEDDNNKTRRSKHGLI